MKHVFIITLFIFVSHSKTFAEELHGIFMVVKGDVEVEAKKTGKFKAKVSSKVYAGDTVTTAADGRGKIVMSDRNVLNLSPDTKMTINKYENDSTTGVKNVDIDLSKGKLRSNVEQKYDGEKSQFLIKTPTAVAGVRGTQFLTSFDPASKKTQIVTFKGAVALSIPGSSTQVMVTKGQTSSVSQGQAAPEAPKQMRKEEFDKENKSSNSAKAEQPSESSAVDVASNGKKSDKEEKVERGDRGPASEGPKDKPDRMSEGPQNVETLPPQPFADGPRPPAGPQLPQGPRDFRPPPVNPDLVSGKLKTKVIVIPVTGQ